MKDLYTFDYSAPLALNTYRDVRKIYARLFDDLKIPYLVADADSGNMGGNLSHEFHFPTSKGEDRVISCSDCDYVANEELAEASVSEIHSQSATASKLWRGVSQDRKTLVNVWYSISDSLTEPQVNVHAVKSILPDLDAAVEDPLSLWEHHLPNEVNPSNILSTRTVHPQRILNLIDARVPQECQRDIQNQVSRTLPEVSKPHESDLIIDFVNADPSSGKPLNLLRISDGDQCNHCAKGKLKVQKAIELGHTFHLGARYSEPLNAVVTVPTNLLEDETTAVLDQVSDLNAGRRVPMQMGCHGIGVSRIIGAVADTLADSKGLNWPRVMAPYEVVVIPVKDIDSGALEVYDTLSIPRESSDHVPLDLILDDRAETFPWKMGDADLVGYPVIVVVGRRWKKERICEVQCRRLNVRQDVAVGNLSTFVDSLLCQL
jgi:prolyl-tRNA synthetase